MPSDTGLRALPSPNHVGAVVKDADETAKLLSSIGMGPWQTFEFSQGKDDLIVGEPFTLKVVWARLGGALVLEVLQPLGESLWSRFLETSGEGLHHIAYNVSNYDEVVSKLQEQGGRMIWGGAFEGRRACYFDVKPKGIIIELMENFPPGTPW
jgi:methylmalonyl-CoA/ethylmalonyl-CoA epimerase